MFSNVKLRYRCFLSYIDPCISRLLYLLLLACSLRLLGLWLHIWVRTLVAMSHLQVSELPLMSAMRLRIQGWYLFPGTLALRTSKLNSSSCWVPSLQGSELHLQAMVLKPVWHHAWQLSRGVHVLRGCLQAKTYSHISLVPDYSVQAQHSVTCSTDNVLPFKATQRSVDRLCNIEEISLGVP